MTSLAAPLSTFLREHLPRERGSSPHTADSYAYAFQLLLCFTARRLKKQPSSLMLEHLDTDTIVAFLEDLEATRQNSPRTRNARLAAIKAFFRFVEYRVPSCLDQARRIRAIPMKKIDEALIDYLTRDEMQALLDAPDPRTRFGRRDRAMLHLGFAAGLRVSEIVALRVDQLQLQPTPCITVVGKGRRERTLPLWKETATALKEWLAVRDMSGTPEIFTNAREETMTRSGFEYVLAKHVKTATLNQPSLAMKRVSPHVLRHTCAMHILKATGDVRKVALWLGHSSLQSTEAYLRADPTDKLQALAAVGPPALRSGRFRAPDKLLAMLRKPRPNQPDYAET